MRVISWVAAEITATYTLETLIHKIDASSKTTTITQTNPDMNWTALTKPPDLNDLGTRTVRVTDNGGSTTFDLTFPHVWHGYGNNYKLKPAQTVNVEDAVSCGDVDLADTNAFPEMTFASHPPLPEDSAGTRHLVEEDVARYALDPKGWTYLPLRRPWGDPHDLQLHFPNLSIWNCEDAPRVSTQFYATYSEVALYLTHTTTSYDTNSPSPMDSSVGPPTPSASPPQQDQIETAGPTPSRTDQIFDKPSVSGKSGGEPLPQQINTMTKKMSTGGQYQISDTTGSLFSQQQSELLSNAAALTSGDIQIFNVAGKDVTIDDKGAILFDGQTVTRQSDGRFVVQSKTVTPVKDGKVAAEYLVDGITLTASNHVATNTLVSATSSDSFGADAASAPNNTCVSTASPLVGGSNSNAHKMRWTILAVFLTLISTWTIKHITES